MADRLEEINVSSLSDKLAVLDINAQAGTLTEGLAKMDKNTLGNIFSRVEADALVEILSG